MTASALAVVAIPQGEAFRFLPPSSSREDMVSIEALAPNGRRITLAVLGASGRSFHAAALQAAPSLRTPRPGLPPTPVLHVSVEGTWEANPNPKRGRPAWTLRVHSWDIVDADALA